MTDAQYAPLGGRVGTAYALSQLPWHIAIGRGQTAWDAVPRTAGWAAALAPDAAAATALVDEIGRRLADEVAFVTPDATGDIELPDGRWKRSGTPTQHLYVRAQLDFTDGAGQTVREAALFAAATPIGLPAGQRWFTPVQLTAGGHLMQLVRFEFAFVRSGSVRQAFHFVQTF